MAPHAIYARAKLSEAIDQLARHPGNLRRRLRSVATEIALIPRDGLPDFERVAEDIRWVQDQLARREPRFAGDSRVAATLYGMRDKMAIGIVDRILAAESKLGCYISGRLATRAANCEA
jgi:hypothetical protein